MVGLRDIAGTDTFEGGEEEIGEDSSNDVTTIGRISLRLAQIMTDLSLLLLSSIFQKKSLTKITSESSFPNSATLRRS